jgi:hypothetical protein
MLVSLQLQPMHKIYKRMGEVENAQTKTTDMPTVQLHGSYKAVPTQCISMQCRRRLSYRR